MQKSLAVFAIGEKSSIFMAEQIRQIFSSDAVTVSSYCLEELKNFPAAPVEADLALISCKRSEDTLTPFIAPSVPKIIANRTLKLDVIDKLIDLPPGTKTLLVTKTKIGTDEATQTIDEIGLSNILVHSFFTDDYDICSSINTILLFDEPEQIPPWATNIIDLGVREVELSSLVEIATRLNEPLKINIPVSIHYLQEIVQRSQRLLKSIKSTEQLYRQLNVVLNNIKDCLIVVDPDNSIRFLNDAALEFIGPNSNLAIGKPLNQIIPELKEINQFSAPTESIIAIGNQTFHLHTQLVKDTLGQHISSIITMRNTTEVIRMENEIRQALKARGYIAKYTFDKIIGNSKSILDTIHTAKKLASSDLSVMIYGENGTGKELFAHSIHSASPRANGPFVAVNCAALSTSLLESELFGYEEGSFTGAKKGGKPGLIEQANGGTIFFDEIGDIPLDAQTRLLRVIQEKAIMRIGSTRVIPVNIRIIAATNKNLNDMIEKGEFRQDLFYRLYVAPLRVPPLRNRLDDIPQLIIYFMRENNVGDYLSEELLMQMSKYHWPGNIRELQSVIQYASVMGEDRASFTKAIMDRINPNNSQSIQSVIPIILEPKDLPLYVDILKKFSEAKVQNIHLGRRSLYKHLELFYPSMTEQSIRNRIVKLAKAGFLDSGTGRQGTQITASGEAFIIKATKFMRHSFNLIS